MSSHSKVHSNPVFLSSRPSWPALGAERVTVAETLAGPPSPNTAAELSCAAVKTPSAKLPASRATGKPPSAKVPTLRASEKPSSAKVPALRATEKPSSAKLPTLRARQKALRATAGTSACRGAEHRTRRFLGRAQPFYLCTQRFLPCAQGREPCGAKVLALRLEVFRSPARVFRLRTRLLPLRVRVSARSAGLDLARVASAGTQMQSTTSVSGAGRRARGHRSHPRARGGICWCYTRECVGRLAGFARKSMAPIDYFRPTGDSHGVCQLAQWRPLEARRTRFSPA